MKHKTLGLVCEHLKSGNIRFHDNLPLCDYYLTKSEIRDIISSEYGIRPKRSRVVKKYLKRISNDLLRLVIWSIKHERTNKGISAKIS